MLSALALGATSCSEKVTDEDTDETTAVVNVANVAVTSFSLKSDVDVAEDLDSVFFSIDLEHGVIFNADSLPKGSKIDKLVPVIRYSDFVTSALIIQEGGTTRNDTVNYITNSSDSIDFTGKVRLQLATYNDELKKEYVIKINVHNQLPDSLVWDEVALTALPSRMPDPRNQKSVEFGEKAYSLIEENDGSYTLAVSDNLFENRWQRTSLSLSFTPDVRSLAACDDALYILDSSGALYKSPDGILWSATGENWNSVIGGYNASVLGIKTEPRGLVYAQYPDNGIARNLIDPEFPVEGHSNFVNHSNKWTSSPVGFFCGGVKADGSLSDGTWAFDGTNWICLTDGGFPAVKGASLIPYYAFRHTGSGPLPSELEAWMLLGGEMRNGEFNRTVYISYDNGVNWRKGDKLLQLPDVIPAMTACDNIVLSTKKDTNLSDAWTIVTPSASRRKVQWSVDGDILSWECPYIYLIGGWNKEMKLCNTIWRGALNRLTFAPII